MSDEPMPHYAETVFESVFKCGLCGARLVFKEFYPPKRSENARTFCANAPHHTDHLSHACEDGGIGRAVFVGFQVPTQEAAHDAG